MREKWAQALDEVRRRMQELVEAVDEVLRPAPELVPVPIDRRAIGRGEDPRGGRRRRG